jgi:hypothetical protein
MYPLVAAGLAPLVEMEMGVQQQEMEAQELRRLYLVLR